MSLAIDTFRQIRAEFGTLKIIEGRDNSKMQKAIDKLGRCLAADETILFAGKGYDLLVTDRFIYGSVCSDPLPLEKIFIATSSRFDLMQFMSQSGGKAELLVNGTVFVSVRWNFGVMPFKFLIRVLEALGEVRRKEISSRSSS